MSKIVKTYTLRKLRELRQEYLDGYPDRKSNSLLSFLAWLQEHDDNPLDKHV